MASFLFKSKKSYLRDMYVLIIVGEAELSSLVQSSLTAEGGYLRITGRNDRLLYECGAAETYGGYPDPEFSGEAFAFREEDGAFVAEYRLEGTGWRVLSVRPYAEIARNLRRMSRNIWGFVALSLAVGAGVAVFFSLRKTAPVMSLLRDNRVMEEQLEAQKPLLLNTFLERLLTGSIGEEEIARSAAYLQFPDLAQWQCAMVHFFDFRRKGEDAEELRVLFRSVMQAAGEPCYCHNVGSDKITCIFSGPSALLGPGGESAWRNLLRQAELDSRCRIAVAIGADKRDLKALHLSVKELLHILDHKNWEEDFQLLRAEDCNAAVEMVRETHDVSEWLALLKTCIQAGSVDKTAQVFRTVRTSLLARNDLRQNRIFLYTLLDYLDKGPFAQEPEVRQTLGQMEDEIPWASAGDLLHHLEKLCVRAAAETGEQALRRKQTVFDDLIRFVEKNYPRQDLSLSMLSGEFGISETYLSQQFKRRFGENLSVYIENIRMQRAQELLLHSKLTINEIAGQVGYNSANTFGKVFHKKYNVSPSVYRSSQRQQIGKDS